MGKSSLPGKRMSDLSAYTTSSDVAGSASNCSSSPIFFQNRDIKPIQPHRDRKGREAAWPSRAGQGAAPAPSGAHLCRGPPRVPIRPHHEALNHDGLVSGCDPGGMLLPPRADRNGHECEF